MSEPLPVIDILNNVIVVNNYLYASQTATLAPAILSNPAYTQLVTEFNTWRYQIWNEYFSGLIDFNLMAQPEQIAQLYALGIANQKEVQSILFASGGAVPGVVSLCDDVASLIEQGNGLVTQLDNIAKSIQGADQAAVAAFQAQVNSLQDEFNKQEDALTQDIIDTDFDLFSCAIDVTITLGSEGGAIKPLVKSVTKIGKDLVNELMLTNTINGILANLETAWSALDEASAELAQINLTVNQLNAVVTDTSAALTALNAVVNDWSQVADVSTESAADWASTGSQQMNEWADRMIQVSFTTATQNIVATT